jgi:GT2 family glycosyltransferase
MKDYRVNTYLVDNSETDYYVNEIKKSVTPDYVIMIDNHGYSHGNNCGITQALNDGCNYIVVINNDTIVDRFFLNPLIELLEKNQMSIVAPVIYYADGKRIWSSGGVYRQLLCDYAMVNDAIEELRKTEFVSGCCFATSDRLINKVGLLNEELFMYNEDVDFCHRAKLSGADIAVTPSSIIYHKVSKTTGANSPFQLYYTYRNRLIFAKQFYTGLNRCYAIQINKLKIFYRKIKFQVKGEKACSEALRFASKDYKTHTGRTRY